MKNKPKIEQIKTTALIPYARNSRTHSEAQIAQIAGSIREFGFTNPVLIDADNGIIAGHGRIMAAQKLGLEEVPCIRLDHLTDTQKRAYIIADNKLALNAAWDEAMLGLELADLRELNFDLDLTGFDGAEIEAALNPPELDPDESYADLYSHKVETPIYEPKGEKPQIEELANREKANKLIAEIKKAKLPADVSSFLEASAARHVVFDYGKIAEFYCHADKQIQELMEDSALVIIDFKKAIAAGYVNLTKRLQSQFQEATSDFSEE
jgi:ParB-like chromosome segregation protein Spo0J